MVEWKQILTEESLQNHPENECFHPLHQDQDQLDCSQKVHDGVVLVQTFLNMRRVNGNA